MVTRKAAQSIHSIISNTLRFKLGSTETTGRRFLRKCTAQIITFKSFPAFLKL